MPSRASPPVADRRPPCAFQRRRTRLVRCLPMFVSPGRLERHAVAERRIQAPTAPLFETGDKRSPPLNKPRAVAKHPVGRPASARAPRPQLRGPTARPGARRPLPASPREPPAFRRGDRVARRFAHALRLRGALASRARPPCWRAPAPCGHALGRPTGHSWSPEPQCTALPPPSEVRRVRSESSAGETSRPPPSLDPSVRSNPGGGHFGFDSRTPAAEPDMRDAGPIGAIGLACPVDRRRPIGRPLPQAANTDTRHTARAI
jgi:hypothetical protein